MENKPFYYKKALPVWAEGLEKEKNITLSFSLSIDCAEGVPAVLYASTSGTFTVFVNGDFVAYGPARTAHGYFRVDEIDLAPHLKTGENLLVVRVTGYNVDSFLTLDQPPFFCAELSVDGEIVAATDPADTCFAVHRLEERLQKVQRYSYQRPFVEVYRLSDGAFSYEADLSSSLPQIAMGDRSFLTRSAPYCDYLRLPVRSVIGGGSIAYSEKESYTKDRAILYVTETDEQFTKDENTGEELFLSKGYCKENLEFSSYKEVGMMDFTKGETDACDPACISLTRDRFVDLDMGANETGLFSFTIEAAEESEFFLIWNEVLVKGEVLACRPRSVTNVLALLLKPGKYTIVSAEPYTAKYLRLALKTGSVKVSGLEMIEIAFPMSGIKAHFKGNDEQMKKIYDAAIRTFRDNVVDVYMDCPSRERAGWLCDSFFTSRVERLLTGESAVELDFLEAFVLPDHFPRIPDKMLPMCYPCDHNKGRFIPNWALWYVLELREYLARTGDRAFVDRAKNTVLRLAEWFVPHENEDGLLEKLPGWVFVEWSMANKLVQDVSYASNMLYAQFLEDLDFLYAIPEFKVKAEKIRSVIRKTAMVNGYFCDNAVRNAEGELVLSGECTEACQYYAFYMGVATPETYPELWETLVRDFGFERRETKKHPEIHPANAFIGNYLRLDLLRRYGYKEQLEQNVRDYFTYMAETTGTLWEHDTPKASCNHGFASHVLVWMDYLGYIER